MNFENWDLYVVTPFGLLLGLAVVWTRLRAATENGIEFWEVHKKHYSSKTLKGLKVFTLLFGVIAVLPYIWSKIGR